ncbi:MAG: hypothetical protein ACLP1D_12490 [Xanthobacteraceae bacterium]
MVRRNSESKRTWAPYLMMAGMALLFAAPAAAQTDSKTILVQDFKAFVERCKPGTQPPAALSPSCANELAGLTRRENDLHLTDADLEAAGVRGGLRGGLR